MLIGLGCGCLLALGIGLAPRIFLILAWIFSDCWNIVWQGDWLFPLSRVLYSLLTRPSCICCPGRPASAFRVGTGRGIALGVMLDIMKWSSMVKYRKENEYYPATMP